MRRECRERFPRDRLQRNWLISDHGMHHGTCVTHVPWCIPGSQARGGRENVPGIPGATRWWEVHGVIMVYKCMSTMMFILKFSMRNVCKRFWLLYIKWCSQRQNIRSRHFFHYGVEHSPVKTNTVTNSLFVPLTIYHNQGFPWTSYGCINTG